MRIAAGQMPGTGSFQWTIHTATMKLKEVIRPSQRVNRPRMKAIPAANWA